MDIVDRLRQIAATKPGEQSLWDCTVAAWAADEIERLRASLNQIADPLMLKMPGTVGMELAMKLILRMQEIAKAALVEQDSALAGGAQ